MAYLHEPFSQLISAAIPNTPSPLHTDWSSLPLWLKTTLGDTWNVQYEQICVCNSAAQAYWNIADSNDRDRSLTVQVDVASVLEDNGHLDVEKSNALVRRRLSDTLMSTTRPGLWTSRTLPGLDHGSLVYDDHIPTGRIIHVVGNAVVDISGMESTNALHQYFFKLLHQTFSRDLGHPHSSPLSAPVLTKQEVKLNSELSDGATLRELETGLIIVSRENTRFSVIFEVDRKIAATSAQCDDAGKILFERHDANELRNTVELFFIAHKVGRHCVRVYVAAAATLI
ncbi:hypothetical protein H0H93_002173 [Arthromyces matolae]|nr:hypothetical protein H0H93_002173 [Arthromyces matolae]